MELTKRFLFRGNASALSGLFYRPDTVIVDMPGASSLGVSGGRSQAQIPGRAFGDVIRFGSAMTFAEGLYDDEKQAKAVSDHKGLPEELNSTTNVAAEIRELAVGQKPLFRAKRIRGALVSKSPRGSGEPSIAPAKGSVIQGVDIGGFALDRDANFYVSSRTHNQVYFVKNGSVRLLAGVGGSSAGRAGTGDNGRQGNLYIAAPVTTVSAR